MNENRESFRKIGLTFEEKAFYNILISLRDQCNFEYGIEVLRNKASASAKIYQYETESNVMKVAEDSIPYGKS